MRVNQLQNKFNRGIVDPLSHGRVDFENLFDACEVMDNFQPMRLGPMMFRPGTEYIGDQPDEVYQVEFHFAQDDVAILEFSNNQLRIWEGDEVVTRVASTSSITNGTFDTDLTGWTDNDEGGAAVSDFKAGGYMSLIGDGSAAAVRTQQISTQVGAKQSIKIVILDAPVTFSIGYTAGGTDLYGGVLPAGTHSLSYTPTSSVYIQFQNTEKYEALVDSVEIESAGIMELPTTTTTALLPLIRYKQSADVVFLSVEGTPMLEVQRRGIESWSIVESFTTDGPFGQINITQITLTAAAISGDTTLTASAPLFSDAEWLGALVRLDSIGQTVNQIFSGENQQSSDIRVTGIEDSRKFQVIIADINASTITLQRSAGGIGSWEDFRTYTTNGTKNVDDGLDNAIMHYRVTIETGDYGSGSPDVTIEYPNGSITGYAKVTDVTNSTTALIKIFKDLGSTDPTINWYRGLWNLEDGYPTAVDLYEGRLVPTGKNRTWHSVSENYRSFDDTIEGDSKAFQRTIGFGAVDVVNWIVSFKRMVIGTAGSEIAVRSTSFEEPLTATTTNLREISSQGSAKKDKVKVGSRGYFIQYSGTRIYELIDNEQGLGTIDLMTVNPEIALVGIKRIVAQHQPEKRIHIILNDGTVLVLMMDDAEEIRAFYRFTFDGEVVDAVVTKGTIEDNVYYSIVRNGTTRLEKFALMYECRGGDISKALDSHVHYSSPGTAVLTGLGHLEGETVGIWGDGQHRGTAVVSGGSITAPATYSEVTVGLEYVAQYKSLKTGYATRGGSHLNQLKKVSAISFLLKWVAPGALTYGPEFDELDPMPDYESGIPVSETETRIDYDEVSFPFDGRWEADSRICLQATRPVTVLSTNFSVEVSSKR